MRLVDKLHTLYIGMIMLYKDWLGLRSVNPDDDVICWVLAQSK